MEIVGYTGKHIREFIELYFCKTFGPTDDNNNNKIKNWHQILWKKCHGSTDLPTTWRNVSTTNDQYPSIPRWDTMLYSYSPGGYNCSGMSHNEERSWNWRETMERKILRKTLGPFRENVEYRRRQNQELYVCMEKITEVGRQVHGIETGVVTSSYLDRWTRDTIASFQTESRIVSAGSAAMEGVEITTYAELIY